MGSRRRQTKPVEDATVVVLVRPSLGRNIPWWIVDENTASYQYASVYLSDNDSLGGYSTGKKPDPTCAVPPSYVERVKRLWREEYPGRWAFLVKKIPSKKV